MKMNKNLQTKISALPEVEPDKIDMTMIADFEGESPHDAISWEEYKQQRQQAQSNKEKVAVII